MMFSLLSSKTTRLTTRQPSSTTVLYAASDAPLRQTHLARFTFVVSLVSRLVLVILAVSIILLQARAWSYGLLRPSALHSTTPCIFPNTRNSHLILSAAELLARFGIRVSSWWTSVVCVAILWALSRREHTHESVLVIRGLGIQTSTTPASYLVGATTRFIPTSMIQDVFIHEAFRGFEVRFYLAIIVKGEKEAVVVFPKLLPRRDILETVWRGTKMVLYQPVKPV